MLSGRRLRQRCANVVAALELPEPFGVDSLCERIAQQRGRPIHLVPTKMPVRVSGLWVCTDVAEIIMYESRTSKVHQQHIILHEIGHLLSGHDAMPALSDEPARLLLPSINPQMVQRMLCRTRYTAPEEREAETIAWMLQEQGGRWRPPRRWAPKPDAAGIARRLERSLEQHRDFA